MLGSGNAIPCQLSRVSTQYEADGLEKGREEDRAVKWVKVPGHNFSSTVFGEERAITGRQGVITGSMFGMGEQELGVRYSKAAI